jgi:hypothetical protein
MSETCRPNLCRAYSGPGGDTSGERDKLNPDLLPSRYYTRRRARRSLDGIGGRRVAPSLDEIVSALQRLPNGRLVRDAGWGCL